MENQTLNIDMENINRDDSTNAEILINNQPFLATYKMSSIGNLCYVFLTPKATLLSPIYKFRSITLLIIFIFLLIGLSFSLLFTKNTYSPLADTVSFMKNLFPYTQENIMNEYDFIKSNAYNYYNQQQNAKPSLIQILIYRAIYSEFGSYDNELITKVLGNFPTPSIFATVIIHMELKYDEFYKLSHNEQIKIIDELANILDCFCPPVQTSNNEYVIILNATTKNIVIELLNDLVKRVETFCSKNNKYIHCIVATSENYSNFSDTKTFYHQAHKILTMRNINLQKRIYTVDDMGNKREELLVSLQTKKMLKNYVVNGSTDHVEDLLEKTFEDAKRSNTSFCLW